ncbi:hypothetical protein PAMP_017334 [Pampus punctatissimus]
MDITVEVQYDNLHSSHSDMRLLIHDRDPKRVNKSLKVMFEDVIAELPSVRSFDGGCGVTSCLRCPDCGATASSPPAGSASLTGNRDSVLCVQLPSYLIWLIMPCVQLLLINMHSVQTVWSSILNILISPFFPSIGKHCGRITIRWLKMKTDTHRQELSGKQETERIKKIDNRLHTNSLQA